jgi:DNA repair exonuclease SbcCD ATPase subunit
MMKKFLLFISMIFVFGSVSAGKPTLTQQVFSEYVENTVNEMQQIIGFTDSQASQIKEIELKFLLDVQKAENCCLCHSGKRIKKLKENRKADLQKILSRDQYIRYDAILGGRIKKIPVRVEK